MGVSRMIVMINSYICKQDAQMQCHPSIPSGKIAVKS